MAVVSKSQQVSNITSKYFSLTPTSKQLLNEFLQLEKYKHPEDPLIPSQEFMAKSIGRTIRSVSTSVRDLDNLDLIGKYSRGWKAIDPKNKFFRLKTCKYSLGNTLIKNMRQLAKKAPPNSIFLRKLFEQIPALKQIFWSFFLVTNLFFYSSNIKSNTQSLRREEITFFGQNNYETAKIYEDREILHTITLPVHTTGLFNHPGNVFTQPYPYNKVNLQAIASIRKWILKRGNIYPPLCTQSEYEKLSEEDQKVARYYLNGIKQNHSMYAYHKLLIKLNQSYKIRRYEMNAPLTPSQIKEIKNFPEFIIKQAREALRQNLDKKQNFQWIFDFCSKKLDMYNQSIKQTLKQNGYSTKGVTDQNNITIPVGNKPNSEGVNFMKNLIGEETYNKIQENIKFHNVARE